MDEEVFKYRMIQSGIRLTRAASMPGLTALDAALDEQDAIIAEWCGPCECCTPQQNPEEN